MDIVLKKKFIPQIHEESTDINTTLFVFIQLVSENIGSKKIKVNYLKRDGDGGCIFDGVQNLLKTVSIELNAVPMGSMDFCSFSLISDPPHIVYSDDLLRDPMTCQAMINTVPPSCFVISRELTDSSERIGEDYYYPLYKIGKGKDKLELARWKVLELWRQIASSTRISVVSVTSESDFENLAKALKDSSRYRQLIIVTKYPDVLGVKEKVHEHRLEKKQSYAFVVLTNSEVDEKTLKSRIRGDLMCSILNNGVWGGEYYVPTMESA